MSVILKTLAYFSPTAMAMWDTKQLQQNPRYMKHLLIGSWWNLNKCYSSLQGAITILVY